MKERIGLSQGSGGKEMAELIGEFKFKNRGDWKNTSDDASTYDLGDGRLLVFSTDSYTIDPIFFPNADIGHLAVSGTINDLVVMGADPIGLSLSFVIEEGLEVKDLECIVGSIRRLCEEIDVPIATGDTKVMGKGKLDKIIINTSGVGIVEKGRLLDKKPMIGDKIILSGGLAEHAVALLSKRFDYTTDIVSDSKPLIDELRKVRDMIKVAKDPTRGGISASLNEICERYGICITVNDKDVPVKQAVESVCNMLGLNVYDLACEGRFVCVTSCAHAETVLMILRKFNKDAAIIGEVCEGDKVIVQTELGRRILPPPTGEIVPRIC